MIRRASRNSTSRRDLKGSVTSWYVPTVTMNEHRDDQYSLTDDVRESEVQEENKENLEALNLETEKVLDTFLSKALGSSLSVMSQDCSITSHSCEDTESLENESEKGSNEDLYHTVSGYRALTQKQRIKKRSPILSTLFNVKELKKEEYEEKNKLIQTLEDDIVTQKVILHQTTKAVNHCSSKPSLRISSHRIECERLLLLSTHRYNCINKTLKHLKTDQEAGFSMHSESGTVRISDLIFHFKDSFSNNVGISNIYYMCMVSHENNVQGSRVYRLSRLQRSLILTEDFSFKSLLNDFVINIQVYSLDLEELKKIHKLYFKKFLPQRYSSTYDLNQDYYSADSLNLTSEDVFKKSDFQLEISFNLTLESVKPSLQIEFACGWLGMSLIWDVEAKVHLSGFLSIAKNFGEFKVWDRKWCSLEGCILKYWNYPSDKDHKPPLGILDLRHCITPQVVPLDRELSPRRRTFVLEMKLSPHIQIDQHSITDTLKHFFCADTSKELSQWCSVLSKHLKLLKEWKVI